MGLTHVTVALRELGSSNGAYEADFLVDTGATDCRAPADKLVEIGVKPVGTMVYELADGTKPGKVPWSVLVHEGAIGALVSLRKRGKGLLVGTSNAESSAGGL